MMRFWKRLLSAFLLGVLSLLLFSSCGGGEEPPAPTDKLVVYCPTTMNPPVTQAKNIYESRYPDVELTYVEFGPYSDREAEALFNERLKVELMAGKGPDIVIFDADTFDDLYKVLDAHVFYDINKLIAADDTFDKDDYLAAIFDGGIYKDQRLFVPLDFRMEYLLAEKSVLEAEDISLLQNPTFSEWSREIFDYIETHNELENRNIFYAWYPTFTTFLTRSGLQILDYETSELYIDTDEFREFMETYKALYRYRDDNPNIDRILCCHAGEIDNERVAVCEGNNLFHAVAFAWALHNQSTKEWTPCPDTLFAFPRFNGTKAIAVGVSFAAVNNASPNKINAYNFLKVLLSNEAQFSYHVNPVNKNALSTNSDENVVRALEGEAVPGYENVLEIEYYRNYSNALIDMVYKEMTPFFEDGMTYEECLSNLRRQLETYIYE